jgi:hypothetical protein
MARDMTACAPIPEDVGTSMFFGMFFQETLAG